MGLTKRNRSKNLPERLPCVPTFDTVCALRTLPPEAEETLADAVRLEAEAISPFEEGAYTFSYEVIRRRAEGIDVLVAAASDAVLDGHGHDLLREAGLLGALRLGWPRYNKAQVASELERIAERPGNHGVEKPREASGGA